MSGHGMPCAADYDCHAALLAVLIAALIAADTATLVTQTHGRIWHNDRLIVGLTDLAATVLIPARADTE